MTRKSLLSIAISCAAALYATSALAQGTPSSKATAAVNTLVSCKVSNATSYDVGTAPMTCKDVWTGYDVYVAPDGFVDVMSAPMKVSNSQSLFVSPTLVTGLYTQTMVRTKSGSSSTASAMGGVYLRAVLKDPISGNVVKVADPVAICENDILGCQKVGNDYGVVLDSRIQTLTQALSDCVVNVTVGTVAATGTCSFDSTIDLVLKTTGAHGFNFIFPYVGQGTYNVVIQAALDSGATVVSGSGTAVGSAAFGLGSVTVESVRLVHDFSF
jgi:hypothetical protein